MARERLVIDVLRRRALGRVWRDRGRQVRCDAASAFPDMEFVDFRQERIADVLVNPGPADARAAALQVVVDDLRAPRLPDRFVGDRDAALREEVFDISEAETESLVEPDGVAMISAGNRYPR